MDKEALYESKGKKYVMEGKLVTVPARGRVSGCIFGDVVVSCRVADPLQLPVMYLEFESWGSGKGNDKTLFRRMRTTEVRCNQAFNVITGRSMLYNPWERDVTVDAIFLHLDDTTRHDLVERPAVLNAIPYLH